MKLTTLRVKVAVDLTLWSAIKLRIAGVATPKRRKVTIQELIEQDREKQSA